MGSYAYSKDIIILNAVTATTISTSIYTEGYGFIVASLSSIDANNGSGILYWQGSQDGANWYGVRLTNLNSGSASTAATASAIYQGDIRGLVWFRARLASLTAATTPAGTTTITVAATLISPTA